MTTGRITRIAGPVVVAEGLGAAGLYDVVEVGEAKLAGEIIRMDGRGATIQVYEEDTGMRPGEPVVSLGKPLSVSLGPGLLGTIYDGIQRPLSQLKAATGAFLEPGVKGESLDRSRKWAFEPAMRPGEDFGPGSLIGRARETQLVEHRVLVPPNAKPGKARRVAPAGEYDLRDTILESESGAAFGLSHDWPVRVPRPSRRRLPPTEPLVTGLRVVDMLFPISKGGCAAVPGGFGTGKTMTQHAIAKWCDADIIVYVGCGERGNEMTDVLTEFPKLVDPRTGRSIMERTILIANTSNMPVAAREVSIYTGITLAEYYRDMGYGVAVMADSTSRWAEALRELSGRLEEMPAEEGFPAYLPTRLAEFYERGGRVETMGETVGSVSIIGAVSPPGGDFSEPVTQHTKRFIRCFWALDRDLANARHYPAISWIDSYSEYAEEVAEWWDKVDPEWRSLRGRALELLKREQRLEQIVRLIGPDALPDEQRLVLMTAEIVKSGFLQQSSFDEVDKYCAPRKQVLLLRSILEFHRRAEAAIKAGAPLPKISALPVRERLSRMKSEVPNEAEHEMRAIEDQIAGAFDELDRQYRKEEAR
ncbi:MAG TPA: V-type ATP synthase subunit A [Spirochaetales bacterium]|nr:V-type ATP synthase subunit A [Spirochaetales bacterium]HRY54749.1 V-type ATP synthase subunit A [Spirochaetia bacterium]